MNDNRDWLNPVAKLSKKAGPTQLSLYAAVLELNTLDICAHQAERESCFATKKLGSSASEINALIDAPLVPHADYPSHKAMADIMLSVRRRLRRILGS